MKLSKLIAIEPALAALAKTKLPAKSSFRVAKAMNLIQPELDAYHKARLDLAARLGTLSEDGSQYLFAGEAAAEFNAAIEELQGEEVGLALPTIQPDNLGAAEIEPAHLAVLEGVLIVEEAPVP